MTTSPFGTPSAFGSAPSDSETDAPRQGAGQAGHAAPRSRKPLLAVGGAAAVVALGAGGWVLFGPSGDVEAEAVPQARGTGVAAAPAETEPEVVPVSEYDVLAGRNPFAAQVVEGGGGAAATTPVTTGTGTVASPGGTSVSSGSGSGSSSSVGGEVSVSVPGEAGPAGKDGAAGANGKNGTDGKNGADGADGLTPLFFTIKVIDVDERTKTVDAVVRTSAGQEGVTDLAVGSPFSADADSVASQVTYKLAGTDTTVPVDGQLDFVTITVDGVDYTTQVGETFLGFVYE